jgi:glutathione transport system substrate-binding protein
MRALKVSGLWVLGWALVAVGLSAPALAGERVITIAQYADLISLDPQHTNDNASYSIQKPMLEGLIGFNEKMEQIPQLAERWDASPDARVYTLYLRKGVKFHDGTPFNAAAVKANFDRVRNPANKLLRYTLYKIISQIDVLDDSTVRFTLSEPFGAMLATFAHPAGAISSPTAVQKYGKDYGTNPVGTGPYQFAEWVPNAHITLVKNPDYWDKANDAKVDKLIIKPVPEDGTRIAMLQKGEAQFIYPVPYVMAEVVQQDKSLTGRPVPTCWLKPSGREAERFEGPV